MEYAAAVYLIAAVLLGAAGAAKAVAPESASSALARLQLYHRPWAVRFLGLVELVVAVSAFIVGGIVPATALAALYAGFAVVAAAMVRTGSGEPCGCFGPVEMPATWRHMTVNLLAVVISLVAASWPVEAVDQLFESDQWLLVPFFVVVVGGAYGVFAWLSRPPKPPRAARS
ncbi:MauE/DoxX family redox-associated membrane protein [Candidatus Poriferisocius sp.]|uniref:MauE/DoxX family redox-associated membrane protein n=1 Tax=Candidatus Poriferisocius sp. TaxID=3101276 RepID=UPI003B0190BA